jgi:hypothetical protein
MSRFRCTYCARWLDDEKREAEHVVPRAIGGSVTTRRVCDECNRRAGREVDGPLLRSIWVAMARHRHAVADPRDPNRPPDPPRLLGTWEDGSRGMLDLHRDGPRARVISEFVPLGENAWKVPLPLDAPSSELRRLLDRLERREGGLAEIRKREPMPEQTINVKLTEQLHTWPRFGSKIGLWLGSHVFGDEWLDTEVADSSRKILWDDPREVHLASPLPTRPDSVMALMFESPMHTVFVMPRGDHAMAMVCLFGEWLYGSPLDREFTDEMPAWVIDPHARTFRETNWKGLIVDAARRAERKEGVALPPYVSCGLT